MNDSEVLLTNILSLGEHSTWQNCVDSVEQGLNTWLSSASEIPFRRIYIVGCGTSYYAAQVGKYLVEQLTHIPVEAHQAFAFSLYTDSNLLDANTLVIGISTTGNTEAVCDALTFAGSNGADTLAFTADASSRITGIAQTTILTGGRVTIAVKTETYLQSLICLYLFGIKVGSKLGLLSPESAEDWRKQIPMAEEVTRQFLKEQKSEIDHLVELYGSTDMVFIVGTGPNIGTAHEASLKVVEMAKMYSVSQELEDFLHGYDREANEGSPIFLLAPQGKALDRMLDFLTFTRKAGVPSIILTTYDNPDIRQVADHVLLLNGDLKEFATPLAYITPFYLFSYQMAVRRGYDPSARRFPGILPIKIRYREEYK